MTTSFYEDARVQIMDMLKRAVEKDYKDGSDF